MAYTAGLKKVLHDDEYALIRPLHPWATSQVGSAGDFMMPFGGDGWDTDDVSKGGNGGKANAGDKGSKSKDDGGGK